MDYIQPSFSQEEEPVPLTAQKEYIELAEDMAYAEKPYRDEAVELKKLSGTEAAVTALGQVATEKGNEVGRAYVAKKQAELDALRGQFDTVAEQEVTVETDSSLEQWAFDVKQSLAEQYKVSPEDFDLFSYTDDKGNTVNTVAYTAPNGIDLGSPDKDYDKDRSWSKIMVDNQKNNARHILTIDGKDYDDRDGMTYALYDALVAKATADGTELPDSQANKLDNGWYTWTLMTGEPLTAGGFARFAGVDDDGSVCRYIAGTGDDARCIRFRPAVIGGSEIML